MSFASVCFSKVLQRLTRLPSRTRCSFQMCSFSTLYFFIEIFSAALIFFTTFAPASFGPPLRLHLPPLNLDLTPHFPSPCLPGSASIVPEGSIATPPPRGAGGEVYEIFIIFHTSSVTEDLKEGHPSSRNTFSPLTFVNFSDDRDFLLGASHKEVQLITKFVISPFPTVALLFKSLQLDVAQLVVPVHTPVPLHGCVQIHGLEL